MASIDEQYIRLPQVSDLIGAAPSTIWEWIRNGKFPKQIKISKRMSVWKKSEILNWMESKIA